MNSKTFCIYPFTGLSTRQDGSVKACYRSKPIGHIQDQSLEEIWNNKNMCRIRQQLLNNKRPLECEPCFSLEDVGVESLRQRHNNKLVPESRINLYPDVLKELNDDFSMPYKFPILEIKLNNLCNLKCRMCNPMDSTSWNDWDTIEEFYITERDYLVTEVEQFNLKKSPYLDKFQDNSKWWNSFEKIIPYLRIVEFAGGEPLIDPQHYRILDMLSTYGSQIDLRYSTNLTILGKGSRTVWDYWPKFKNIKVNVSIDGFKESYEYIRSNSSWSTIVKNIQHIKNISNVSRIVGATVVQVSNILVLDKMIEHFLNELEIIFYITNMVRYPNVLSIQVLPQSLKELAINRLTVVKSKIPQFKLVQKNPKLLSITINQIDDVITFLQANNQSHLWNDCVEFNKRLDLTRGIYKFEDVTPEFRSYIK